MTDLSEFYSKKQYNFLMTYDSYCSEMAKKSIENKKRVDMDCREIEGRISKIRKRGKVIWQNLEYRRTQIM